MPSPPANRSIYIARGDETLGPYNAREAGELIKSGYLSAGDLAARDGDGAWVPLYGLLGGELVPGPAPVPQPGETATRPKARRWSWPVAIVLFLAIVAGATYSLRERQRKGSNASQAAKSPRPIIVPPDGPMWKDEDIQKIVTPRTDPRCHLDGRVAFTLPDHTTVTFAGVRVDVYPLDDLMASLTEKKARVQTELDRLDPQLAAAEKERANRIADEQAALKTLLATPPTDTMHSSLVFAHEQTKTSLRTAEDDYRYLVGQRRDVMDGESYFHDLPPAPFTTETDEDGRFTLEFPQGGAFALAVRAKRGTGDQAHMHYWLVKVALEDGDRKTIVLDNENVASAGAPDSLIQTAD